MKKSIILVVFMSFAFMQGKIGGYAIFNYTGSTQQFDVDRSYFQYTNDISDDLFFKIRFDVGRSSDILDADSNNENDDQFAADVKLSAYLKNVYVDWKCPTGGKLTIGLLGTNSYGIQETNWGYRFIGKSVLDQYKMTNTADFGFGYSHSFGNFNMNMQFVNGEGYNANFDSNNTNDNKPAAYIRLMYGEKKITKNDGFNVGLVYTSTYNDYSNNLVGLFGGWAGYNCRLGIEMNTYEVDEITETANALYFNYSINDKIDLFLRHDMNDQDIDTDFIDNNGLDMESRSMLGVVWNATKGLYFSPNVIVTDAGDGTDSTNEYRLTCMFKY